MFENVLHEETKGLLRKIGSRLTQESFYLAGGTGLALQMGHRISEDFHFFRETPFDPESLLSALRPRVSSVHDISIARGTPLARLEEVRCSFFFYKVPLLFEKVDFGEIEIAEWRDIVVEKMKTIAQRGSKKDFYDVYSAIISG